MDSELSHQSDEVGYDYPHFKDEASEAQTGNKNFPDTIRGPHAGAGVGADSFFFISPTKSDAKTYTKMSNILVAFSTTKQHSAIFC